MKMKQQSQNKKQLFIGATLQPIQNCELLASSEDSTLFVNKRSLIIMNIINKTLKSSLIQDERILSATYYSNLEVFIVNTDKYLIIINKQAEIINRQRVPQFLQAKSLIILNMQDGYEGVPFQRKDLILFFTNQYMFQITITIKYERSLLKTKSLCSFQIQLKSKPQIIHFEWTSNFIYKEKNRLLICWNQSEAYVFQTPKKLSEKPQLNVVFDKIMRRSKTYENDNKVNSFEASIKHRLLIAAFQMGSIKVYKLDQTKKYICELKGHQRDCTGLFIPVSQPDLLYSCGLDNSVRIWELIDFGQVYHVRFDIICSKVEMLNENLIFAKLSDNRRAFFIKINTQLLKPLLSEAKSGQIINIVSDGEWALCLYSNNFIQATLLGEYNNECRQFREKIQFPIKYGFIRSSIKIKEDIYAICLEKGFSILRLNKKESQGQNFELKRLVYNHSLQSTNQKGKLIQIIHEKLLDTYFFTIIQDWKNIPIAINVTSVSFLLNVALPKWDLQTKSKSSDVKLDFVILGNDRGHIYFINIKDRSHYHCRVYFHSDPVTNVQRIRVKNSGQLNFLSQTISHEIAIWQISQNKIPAILFRVNYTKDITIMKSHEHYLAVGCKSGQFNILELSMKNQKQKQQLSFSESVSKNLQQGHLKSILTIDFIKYNEQDVWLTGGEDYSIKLWRGIQKQLLIQLRLFSMINYATFVKRDLDIIISHGANGQISVITSKNVPLLMQTKTELQNKIKSQPVLIEIIEKDFFCPKIQESLHRSKKLERLQIDIKSHDEDFLYHRSHNQKLDHINSERKHKNLSPSKANELQSNNSVTLPKIGKKFLFLSHSSQRYEKQGNMRESSILQKLSTSRLKSYSQAGRKKK